MDNRTEFMNNRRSYEVQDAELNKLNNWQTGKRYKCIEIIGRGSYGQVVKAADRLENKYVAIKRMELRHDEPINMKRAYREIRILHHLNHPNVVALVDVVSATIDSSYLKLVTKSAAKWGSATPDSNRMNASLPGALPKNIGDVYLVFECVDTDLSKIIKSNQFLSSEHIQYILFQILEGLLYLHKSNVLHRDLKPANILVSCSDCSIKIADFGLARVVSPDMLASRRTPSTNSSRTSSGSGSDAPSSMTMTRTPSDESLDSLEHPNHAALQGPGGAVRSSGAIAPPPPVLKRGLTKHVVTRWYRAPEVILSQPYSAAVDMWSVGCIFAELLGMMEVANVDCKRRKALFPGDSCGELSADEHTPQGRKSRSNSLLVPETLDDEGPAQIGTEDDSACGRLCLDGSGLVDLSQLTLGRDGGSGPQRIAHSLHDEEAAAAAAQANSRVYEELYCYGSDRSQLSVIFDVIGTPRDCDAELGFLAPAVAKALRKLKRRAPKDFRAMYPGADPEALDLLRSMLQFSPHSRVSVEAALAHPFFAALKTQDYVQQQHQQLPRGLAPGEGAATRYLDGRGVSVLPAVLDAQDEKLNESSENIRHSIVQEILYFRRREEVRSVRV